MFCYRVDDFPPIGVEIIFRIRFTNCLVVKFTFSWSNCFRDVIMRVIFLLGWVCFNIEVRCDGSHHLITLWFSLDVRGVYIKWYWYCVFDGGVSWLLLLVLVAIGVVFMMGTFFWFFSAFVIFWAYICQSGVKFVSLFSLLTAFSFKCCSQS